MKKTVMPRKLYVWIEYDTDGTYNYFASENISNIPYDQHKSIIGIYLKENQGIFTVQTSVKGGE